MCCDPVDYFLRILRVDRNSFQSDAYLNTVEFVPPRVAGQALADVAADHVDAARVGMAVVPEQPARLHALVHIWNQHQYYANRYLIHRRCLFCLITEAK